MRKEKKSKKAKKVKIALDGITRNNDLLIGSHGNTEIKVRGDFQVAGIVYCPKYSVMLDINGSGRIAFRGKCNHIIIKRMNGDCTLDLSEVTYRQLSCESLQGNAIVLSGNARAVTPAVLSGDARLHIHERQLIFNPITRDSSRIILTNGAGVEEELTFNAAVAPALIPQGDV